MAVTAPPRPPPARAHAVEAVREQALIKEARERARRRRQRFAVVAASVAVVGLGVAVAMRPDREGARPSGGAARRLAPGAPSGTRSTIVFARWHNSKATLYTIHSDGTHLRRLLHGSQAKLAGYSPSWPALSPDGRLLAFQTGTWGAFSIDVVKLDGGGVHEVVPTGGRPAWSPDGTKIAYSLLVGKPQGIYVARADGTARRRLTQGDVFASWSPAGTKLAYACSRPARGEHSGLCVMNADGTDQHRIAPIGDFARPAWSPDGSRIAFIGGFPEVRVYVVNADGTQLRRLAPFVSERSQDCGPAWSPDGKRIAFTPSVLTVESPSGTYIRLGGIYLMDANGRHVVHLQGTTGDACGISWQRTPNAPTRPHS
jgi:Tol biopolymer transport system component